MNFETHAIAFQLVWLYYIGTSYMYQFRHERLISRWLFHDVLAKGLLFSNECQAFIWRELAVLSGSFKLLKGKIASLFSQLSTWSFNFTLFRIPFFFIEPSKYLSPKSASFSFYLVTWCLMFPKMGNVDWLIYMIDDKVGFSIHS